MDYPQSFKTGVEFMRLISHAIHFHPDKVFINPPPPTSESATVEKATTRHQMNGENRHETAKTFLLKFQPYVQQSKYVTDLVDFAYEKQNKIIPSLNKLNIVHRILSQHHFTSDITQSYFVGDDAMVIIYKRRGFRGSDFFIFDADFITYMSVANGSERDDSSSLTLTFSKTKPSHILHDDDMATGTNKEADTLYCSITFPIVYDPSHPSIQKNRIEKMSHIGLT